MHRRMFLCESVYARRGDSPPGEGYRRSTENLRETSTITVSQGLERQFILGVNDSSDNVETILLISALGRHGGTKCVYVCVYMIK